MGVGERALNERNWKFQRPDDRTIITGVRTLAGRQYIIVIRHEVEKQTMVLLFVPLSGEEGPPQERRVRLHPMVGWTEDQLAGAGRILLHYNYRIVLGGFEVDANDGELRFRIALPYRDAKLTTKQVNWCIDIATGTLDVFMPKLEGFLNGTLSVDDAIAARRGPGPGMRL